MQISYTHKEKAGKRAIRKGGVGSSRRLQDQVKVADKM